MDREAKAGSGCNLKGTPNKADHVADEGVPPEGPTGHEIEQMQPITEEGRRLMEEKRKRRVVLEQPPQNQEQKNQGNDDPESYSIGDELHHESNYRNGDNDHDEDHEQGKDADRGSDQTHDQPSTNENMRSIANGVNSKQ
jgi:hypothetical protein